MVDFWFFNCFFSQILVLAPSASKRDADEIVVAPAAPTAKRPTKQKRAPLKDISNIGEEEPDPSDGRVESCPTSLQFAKFEYTRKNINKARVEYICKYSRSSSPAGISVRKTASTLILLIVQTTLLKGTTGDSTVFFRRSCH